MKFHLKNKRQNLSSTLIRNLLTDGNIALANQILGRNFSVQGLVIKGKETGKTNEFSNC